MTGDLFILIGLSIWGGMFFGGVKILLKFFKINKLWIKIIIISTIFFLTGAISFFILLFWIISQIPYEELPM